MTPSSSATPRGQKPRAVICDLDDTLYPEREYVRGGFRAVSAWAQEHVGIPADEGFQELEVLFEQGVRGDTFDHWLRTRQLPLNSWVDDMVRIYRAHVPDIHTYPDVRPALDALPAGTRLGLVTDGYADVQRRKLAALPELGDLFDIVVVSDELGRDAWKPSPRPFQAALLALSVRAADTVYIADNPAKDFIGARRLGISTIRIRRADGLYRRVEAPTAEHAPDTEIAGLDGLASALLQLQRR